jgi:hypothetical protein
VVNIGTRQTGRDRGKNVLDVGYNKNDIKKAINEQLTIGKYSMEPIYGDGFAGSRIAKILATEVVDIQKCITY